MTRSNWLDGLKKRIFSSKAKRRRRRRPQTDARAHLISSPGRGSAFAHCSEELPDRCMLANYNLMNADSLLIQLDTNENLDISQAGTVTTFTLTTGTWTQDGDPATTNAGATITIDTSMGDSFPNSLTINSLDVTGGTNDVTFLGGTITSATITVDVDDTDASSAIDFMTAATTLSGNAVLTANGTGAGITDSTGGSVIVTGTATLDAGTEAITLDSASNDFQGTLAVTNSGSATIVDANSLQAGLVNSAGAVSITATAGAITDGNAAANNVAGTTLTASAATGIDLDTAVASVTATTSGAGDIVLNDSGPLTLTTVSTFDGSITVNAGGAVVATSVVTGDNGDDEDHDISITTTSGGTIQVATITSDDDVILNAAGAITDDGSAATEVSGNMLTATAGGDFGASGAGNSIDTNVDDLSVDTSSANGTQWIDEADGLTGLALDAGTGNVVLVAGDDVTDGDSMGDISGTNAHVTVDGDFGATGGGDNNIDTAVDDLTVDTSSDNGTQWIDEADGLTGLALDAGTGNVVLVAGDDVTDGDAMGDISGTNAHVTVDGDFGAMGGGDNNIDTAVDDLTVDTSSDNGTQWIDEADGLTGLALDAGTGNVILVAGDDVTDGDAMGDISGTNAHVTVDGDFGVMGGGDNNIDTAVDDLTVDTSSDNGTQWIDEADGLTGLALDAGTGNVILVAGDDVTDGDSMGDISGTNAHVTVDGDFGAMGGGDNNIDTAVDDLTVDTSSDNGTQWIDEADGLTGLALDVGTGNVILTVGDDVTDGDSMGDISGTNAHVTVDGDFGAMGGGDNNIDTAVDDLTVDTSSDNGTQWIDEADGLTGLALDAGAGNVILVAGDDVTDGDSMGDISGTNAHVTVDGDFGAMGGGDNNIDTAVDDLTVDTSSDNGTQWIDEADGLTGLALDAGTGNVILTAGDDVTDGDSMGDISGTNAHVTVDGDFGATGGGDNNIDTAVDDLTVDTSSDNGTQWIDEADGLTGLALDAGAGNVILVAGDDVTDGDSMGDISGTNAHVTVDGDFGAMGGGDNNIDTAVDDLTVDTSSDNGTQWIDEADGLTGLALDAGTGNVILTAGDDVTDGDSMGDISGTNAHVTVDGDFGATGGGDNNIDTAVDDLTVDTSSDNGTQWIDEADGLTGLALDAGTGNVILVAGDDVTDGDAMGDISGTNAHVTVDGDFGATGGGDNNIDTAVDDLTVDTSSDNGTQWIDEADGLTGLALDAGTGNVVLVAGDDVTDGDSMGDISGTNAHVTVNGDFGATGGGDNNIDTAVDDLTVDTSSDNGTQWIDEADGLTGLALDAGTGNVILTAGDDVTDGDSMGDISGTNAHVTVNGDFGAMGGGDNNIDTAVDDLTVDTSSDNGTQWIDEADGLTGLSLDAGTGNVVLVAGDDVTDGDSMGDISGTNAHVTVDGDFGAMGGGDNNIDTAVDDLTVDTSSDNGTQWIDEADGLTGLALDAGTGNVILVAGDDVTDGDAMGDISGTNAHVTVDGDFGAMGGGDNNIDTAVDDLTVDTSSDNGTQWIDEADGLTGLALDAGTGNVILVAGDDVTDGDSMGDISGTNAHVTVDGDFGAMGGGDNNIDTAVDDLTVDTSSDNGTQWIDEADGLTGLALDAGTGNVILTAGDDVTDGDSMGDISGTNAHVTVDGDFGAMGGGDNNIDTAVDDLTVDTSSDNGTQWIDEADGLTGLALDAGTGNVILVAGDDVTDGDAMGDISGTNAHVTVDGDFGATGGGDNNIDTAVDDLTVDTSSDNGTQWIDEADGLTGLALDAGTGNVVLVAGDDVTDGDSMGDISGTNAHVTVDGDFGAMGGGDNNIDTAVDDLTVDTSSDNGTQWIDEADGLTGLALDAGTGNVVLTAGDAVDDSDEDTDVSANDLDVDAGGAITLDTEVSSISADTTGNLADIGIDNVNDDSGVNGLTITSLTTDGGMIDLDHNEAGTFGNDDPLTISGTVSSGGGGTNGGNIDIRAINDSFIVDGTSTISSEDPVFPPGGSGDVFHFGVSLLAGSTIANGDGNITLIGGGDLVIETDIVTAGEIDLASPRDIVVRATVQSTGSSVELTADEDLMGDPLDGNGGILIEGSGFVDAATTVTLTGSNLFNDGNTVDFMMAGDTLESVVIDADDMDPTAAQVQAGDDITIESEATLTPMGADIIIGGVVNSTGTGTTSIDGENNTLLGNDVTGTNNVDFADNVILLADVTVSGADVDFDGTVEDDMTDGDAGLTVNGSGTTTFTGEVGGNGNDLDDLTTDAAGDTSIDGGAVTTAGAQTYNDAVTLGADTTLTGTDINFGSTVDGSSDGNESLDIMGNANFDGDVGEGEGLALGALTVSGTTDMEAVITTTDAGDDDGSQDYMDAVTVTGDSELNATDVTFQSTVDDDGTPGDGGLTVNASGTTRFNGQVGNTNALTSLSTDSDGGGMDSTVINTDVVSTTGDQTFGDAVFIEGGASPSTTTFTGTNVTFNNTLDADDDTTNDRSLLFNVSNDTTFSGQVGVSEPFEAITTDASGTTNIDTDMFVTNGSSQTFNDAVVIMMNTVLTENGPGDVSFNNTVDSDGTPTANFSLTVITTGGGDTNFGDGIGSDDVGGIVPLASITTDSDGNADGNTIVADGLTLATTGNQTYFDTVSATNATFTAGDAMNPTSNIVAENPGNDFMGTTSVNATGNVDLVDINGFEFGTSTVDGVITIMADGDVTDAVGAIITTPALNITTSGMITIDNGGNAIGDLDLMGTDILIENDDADGVELQDITASATLTVTSVGPITTMPGATISAGTTASFTTFDNAGSDITVDTALFTAGGAITAEARTTDGSALADGDIRILELADQMLLDVIGTTGDVSLETHFDIVDTSADTTVDITAAGLTLRARTGLGTTTGDQDLDTDVDTLAAINTDSGDIVIDNTDAGNALLTIGSSDNLSGVTNALTNAGGTVTVTNYSPMTISSSVASDGAVTLTATDSAGTGDDLAVGPNVAIVSGSDSVTLNAGDNYSQDSTASVTAATSVAINIDNASADGGTAATASIGGVISAGTTADVTGGAGSDTLITPNLGGTFEVTANDTGTLTRAVGSVINFSSIENLTGGTENDTFDLNGGDLTGAVDGVGGSNTLQLDDDTNIIDVTGGDTGTASGTGGFGNVGNINGGSGTDDLTVRAAGSLSGSVNAGGDDDVVTIEEGGSITGTVDGGAGTDELDYAGFASGVAVDLEAGMATGIGGTVSNVENVTGGGGDDDLRGDAAANVLAGGGGSDMLDGNAGDDTMTGGDGDDAFVWNNGDGSDMIDGNADTDSLQVNSGGGDDVFDVRDNASRLEIERTGGGGAFTLDIDTVENLEVNLDDGDDTLVVSNDISGTSLASSVINGGNGGDTVNADLANEAVTLNGNDGDDELTGSAEVDSINGGDGNDTIDGNASNDVLLGEDDDDMFIWNNGDSTEAVEGGRGFDTLIVNTDDGGVDDITVSRDVDRVQVGRTNVNNFNLDIDDVEQLDINTLAGNDRIQVDGQRGTDLEVVNLNGGDDDDFFDIVPTTVMPINVDGGADNASPGDRLMFQASGAVADAGGTGTITTENGVNQVDFINLEGAFTRQVVAGASSGNAPNVRVINPVTGDTVQTIQSYNAGFHGGVRTAIGDVNGDGITDIVTAAGRNGGPHVKVFSGVDGSELMSFMAYEGGANGFRGGVYVAVGDVNDDGFEDIITGAGRGGGPHVKVFSGADGSTLHSFFAYRRDLEAGTVFRGGVQVATADVNGDGIADIVTGAATGGGPHVRIFDVFNDPTNAIDSYFAFDRTHRDGIFVGAGDVDGDGNIEVLAGAGLSTGAEVRVFDGITTGNLPAPNLTVVPFGTSNTSPLEVSSVDFNGDGVSELLVTTIPVPTTTSPAVESQSRIVFGTDGSGIDSFEVDRGAFLSGGGLTTLDGRLDAAP